MLADIFFFFECVRVRIYLAVPIDTFLSHRYLWEEGLGPTSDWEKFNHKNAAVYNHGLNKRLKLADNGLLMYGERIAIRDTVGYVSACYNPIELQTKLISV